MRFPEFSGEWKKYKLSEVCSFYSGGTPSSSKKEYYDGSIPFIRSGEIHVNKTELFITEEGLNNSAAKKVVIGDLLLALYGATSGDIAISQINGAINQAILCIRTTQNKKFVESVWKKHVNKLLQTYLQGGQGNLSAEIVKNISFYLTSNIEQNKLARFVSLLDERIATQNKIIGDLKLLRDAISDAMFCTPKQSAPRKRIKGFYSDWQKVHLKDICSRVSQKNTNGRCDLVLTIAAKYGLVSQLDFFNKSVASENLEGYYLLQKGDFAYNKSYSSEYTCGAVKRLELYEEGVLSPLYICFRPDPSKVNSDYLSYYFESTKWYREIMDISVEGARNHGLLNISVVDYFNTIHRIPNMDEQKCIANVIKAIMHKISSEQTILDCYVKQRIFLLRQMFI